MFRCILCQAASIRYSGEWWACLLQSRDEILLMTSSSSTNQVVADRPEPTGEQSDPPGGDITPRRRQPHFMLVPSLACPAACSYCFGPHRGPTMSPVTMQATLDFMARIAEETGQRKVKITFHGGEPLQAGYDLWRQALQGFDQRLGRGRYEVVLQSNLWLLDDQFCQLFTEHKVEIGTSLDGPEEITDRQRGQGYFARTMQGVQNANYYGMNVGCIATFTPYSARAGERSLTSSLPSG